MPRCGGSIRHGVIDRGKDAFFEGNPFVPSALFESGALDGIPNLSIFLSPLSRARFSNGVPILT